MKRIIPVLMAVLCHGQAPAAAPAMKLGVLPPWETSASAPLRTLPAGCTLLEYVEFNEHQFVDTGYVFTPRDKIEVDWQFTNVSAKQQRVFSQRANPGLHIELYINGSGVHGWAYERDNLTGWKANNRAVSTNRVVYSLDGPNKRMYAGSASWAVSDLNAMTDAECGEGHMFISRNLPQYQLYARCFGCKIWKSGVLVRDYLPVKDSSGVAGLWDRVSGEIHYSATETPLVAGPLVVDPDVEPAALLPHSRNWYASLLLATNPPPPAAPAGAIAIDALVIPEGLYATRRSAGEIVVAEPRILDALVQRYRTGLAPTNIPVNILHSPTNVVGRVTRLWRVPGSGLWARIEAPRSSFSGRLFPSAEVLVLRSTATDDWGSWAEFEIPWQVKGVSLVPEPALAVPSFVTNYPADPDSAYPDPRTVEGIIYRH